MIFTPASFVIVVTMVHFRPYLTALRIRKPRHKCTTAACALHRMSGTALQISRDLLEVNTAVSGGMFSESTTLTIPVALESSAGYESEGDSLEHLKSLDEVIHFAMGQVQ